MKKSRKRIKRVRRKKAKKLIKRKIRKSRKKPRKRRIKRQIKRTNRRFRKTKKSAKKLKKRTRKFRRKVKKAKAVKKARYVGLSLDRLFESPAKVQVMKLFFRNPETGFLVKEAKKRLKINLTATKREMSKLEKIGLLRTKQISARKRLFFINPNFDFFNELRDLILKSSPISKEKILKSIKGLGRIKLVLLSGLFVGNNMSRADLLIVGDNINSRKLNTFIKNLELEAGTDTRCVAMTTEEFRYRYDMYDRFLRDLLSEKCEFLMNKLGL